MRTCFKNKACFAFQNTYRGRQAVKKRPKHREKESPKTAALPLGKCYRECYTLDGKLVLQVPSVCDEKELTGRAKTK